MTYGKNKLHLTFMCLVNFGLKLGGLEHTVGAASVKAINEP